MRAPQDRCSWQVFFGCERDLITDRALQHADDLLAVCLTYDGDSTTKQRDHHRQHCRLDPTLQFLVEVGQIGRMDADHADRIGPLWLGASQKRAQMLASLRSRLERMREELRRESQQLAEQRARQETVEVELVQREEEVRRLAAEVEQAGADAFFYKPIEISAFLETVQQLLGLPSKEQIEDLDFR